ncbi:MAG TPA: dicarboxylate/amino acid:cation symporter [Thermoanaerobaculia bacterium]|nr:dicarboxylate/amino acid:cation symporter [Thermoanaerobaculia bacterium]
MKESTRLLLALGAALAGGIAIAASGSASLLRAADLITPIGTLWVNAIRMTVIPLVISLLITGVASAADVRSIGRIGRRTILVFVLLLAGTAVVVMPSCLVLFRLLPPHGAAVPPLPAGAAEAAGQLASGGQTQTFTTWLLSLLPPNPGAAAATGTMVPLVLFTMLLALAIARSPAPARATLLGFFQALADAMLTLVRWIVMLAPIGVFALVLPLAAHAGAVLAGGIGFYIVLYSIACIGVTALLYPLLAIAARIPMRRFARAALPAQLIAFSSSSSIASLPALVEGAEKSESDNGLGLSAATTGFVLPLAVSTFKIAAPLSWTVGALFVAWFYAIPLHGTDLATIAFAAVFLAFAVPGIPRGAFIMLTPLFLTIGLPAEGIGILIAVDAIPDVFATVLNATGDLAATALVASGKGEGLYGPAALGQRRPSRKNPLPAGARRERAFPISTLLSQQQVSKLQGPATKNAPAIAGAFS